MIEIHQTRVFANWLRRLRDSRAKQRIAIRVQRLGFGHPGDVKSVGGGVSELRIREGPGYRIYFTRRGETLIVLLCGGDKASQRRDIARAKHLAEEVDETP